jgi:hypothetical protein
VIDNLQGENRQIGKVIATDNIGVVIVGSV